MAGTPLHELIRDDGALTYYDEDLRLALELHIPYLLKNGRSTQVPIEPHKAARHEYDFYSLLLDLHIPPYLHWITLRINNMTSPSEYSRDMLSVFIPNPQIIENLKSINTTIHRIDG